MSDLEFVTIGDLHLEKNFKYFERAEGLRLIFKQVDKVIAYARQKGIKHVVQLGDVTESAYPDDLTVTTLLRYLLSNSDLTWHFLRGNHDVDDADNNSLNIPKLFAEMALRNVSIYLNPKVIKLNGIRLCFLPYPYTNVPKTSKEKIVFAHREFSGSIRDNGTKNKEGDEPPTKDHWILGHLHTYHRLTKHVLFVGSIAQHTFGEGIEKGFAHFSITKEGKRLNVDHKFIPIDPTYRYLVKTIRKAKELENISDKHTDLYQLIVKDNVIVPERFRLDHPNVIDTLSFTKKSQIKLLKQQKMSFDTGVEVGHDLKDNLKLWLKSQGHKAGFVKETVALGEQLMEELRA